MMGRNRCKHRLGGTEHDGAYALIIMQIGLLLLNIRGAFKNPV